MNRTYNFRRSQELLHVDPKTFGRWLEKARIDPAKQINRADPREKLLTKEQIILLAKEHGRDLPDLDQENEPEPVEITLTTLNERLSALERLITESLADLQQKLANLGPRISPTRQHTQLAMKSPAPAPSPTRRTSTTARKPAKKTRMKKLPRGLVPLAVFKQEHGISDKAVEYALEKKKITVERGKWVHNNRNVMIALGQQGRHEFYILFHERKGFQRCDDCPHGE